MAMESYDKYEERAEMLKVLAHPVRLCIVSGLMEQECNVTKMQECLNLPQSTVSQHLGILKAKGIVKGKRNGLEICYSVVSDEAKEIVKAVNKAFEKMKGA